MIELIEALAAFEEVPEARIVQTGSGVVVVLGEADYGFGAEAADEAAGPVVLATPAEIVAGAAALDA